MKSSVVVICKFLVALTCILMSTTAQSIVLEIRWEGSVEESSLDEYAVGETIFGYFLVDVDKAGVDPGQIPDFAFERSGYNLDVGFVSFIESSINLPPIDSIPNDRITLIDNVYSESIGETIDQLIVRDSSSLDGEIYGAVLFLPRVSENLLDGLVLEQLNFEFGDFPDDRIHEFRLYNGNENQLLTVNVSRVSASLLSVPEPGVLIMSTFGILLVLLRQFRRRPRLAERKNFSTQGI